MPTSDAMKRRLSNIGLIALAAILLVWVFIERTRVPVLDVDRAIEVPELALVALDGTSVRLSDLRGKVVVLNLWAGWCGPCRAEIPGFANAYRDLHPRGLEILGINTEEMPNDALQRLGADLGVNYPLVRLAEALPRPLEADGVIPQSWWIDRQGRLRAERAGYVSERAFRRTVERLLEEPWEP